MTRNRKPNLTLKALRLNRGLSVNDLAYLAGVSAPTIRLTEAGHIPGPRIQFALAEFFGVAVLHIWPLPGHVSQAGVTA
jgi:transcriptional regulator with XRE-family HTH domain